MTWRVRAAVVVGGMLGTLLRWGLSHLPHLADVPVGTLVANLSGAFVLGLVLTRLGPRAADPRWLPLTSGLLGATTTFSTFAVEVVDLAGPTPEQAVTYVVASLVGGLLAVTAGRSIGARSLPPNAEAAR